MKAEDKQALISKIKGLEGLSNDEKSQIISFIKTKTYGLVWEDSTEKSWEQLKDYIPVLVEDKEKAIISPLQLEGAGEAPNHILIEGDNLLALTNLCYTHEGKVDVIYIDPPYNRGGKDFMYNDCYIDKDNPFKHSLWLSFMKERLSIAKKLLSDRGVLILHIDEHEFDAIHMLLDTEIFSAENNLGMIIWNKLNPKGDAHNVAVMHEYILIFCQNKEAFVNCPNSLMRDKPNAQIIINKGKSLWNKIGQRTVPEDIKSMLSSYGFTKDKISDFKVQYSETFVRTIFANWLSKSNFSKGEKAYKYLDNKGEVFRTVSMAWPNKEKAPDDYWIPLKHPITGEECPLPSKGWRNPPYTMKLLLGNDEPIVYSEDLVVKGEIAFTRKRNGALNIPERLYYLKDNMMENVSSVYNDGSSDEQLLADLKIKFPYPKCLSVAKYLLHNVQREASIILDFFAGSGTTLHATMQLNAEDGGHRQCILVTNNENNICEEVTYERNKRVINGYTKQNGEYVEGLKDNNLRYYKVGFVPREKDLVNVKRFALHSVNLLCIKEDVYKEEKKLGDLEANGFRYFKDGDKQFIVVFETEMIEPIVQELCKMDIEEKIPVYVFTTGQYPYTEDFWQVSDKVELYPYPSCVYGACEKVMPKMEDKLLDQPDDIVLTEEEENMTYEDLSKEG